MWLAYKALVVCFFQLSHGLLPKREARLVFIHSETCHRGEGGVRGWDMVQVGRLRSRYELHVEGKKSLNILRNPSDSLTIIERHLIISNQQNPLDLCK